MTGSSTGAMPAVALMSSAASSMTDARRGLGGLLALLDGCRPGHSVEVGEMRCLLLPLADHIAQAEQALQALQAPRRRRR